MDKNKYYKLYASAHNNAVELLGEAKLLFSGNHYPRAYFLALSALEEIAKSQLAADVWTGFIDESVFTEKFTAHKKKLESVEWATLDANEYSYGLKSLYGTDFVIALPCVKKRMDSLYTDLKGDEVYVPRDAITNTDAEAMIETVCIALQRILENEVYYGHQIGTKGFMK